MRVVVWMLCGLGAVSGTAAGQQAAEGSLQGLSSVSVVVENVDSVALRAGVTADSLRVMTEERLRSASVPAGAVGDDASGTLFVSVGMVDVPGGGGVFAYRWDLTLIGVRVTGGRRVIAPSWECRGLATTVAGSLRRVYDSVDACMDKLTAAWHEANPS